MTFVQHIQHGYDTQNEISVVEQILYTVLMLNWESKQLQWNFKLNSNTLTSL